MSDFTPGVDRARAAGHKIQVAAYPEGPKGIRLSLREVAKKIRDGRLDPDVRGWVGDVLVAAGSPKGRRDQAQAIVDAFRKATVYVPDPVASEYIVSAAGTACLRPGLCVRARDCDDGVVFMGSALMSIGIPVEVVKQFFGEGKQEHVLIRFKDEYGVWVYVDPSTGLSVGQRVPAQQEEVIDPMDVKGSNGTAGVEIVTLGAHDRDLLYDGERWFERRYGRMFVYEAGVGWVDGDGQGAGACTSCEAYARAYKASLGRGGGAGPGGGSHGARPSAHARPSGGGPMRFHEGRWWNYWPEYGWLVVQGSTCGQWGEPIANPDAGLLAAAQGALAAHAGAPTSDVYQGTTYLFQRTGSEALDIRPCVQPLAGVGQAPAPVPAPAAPPGPNPARENRFVSGVAVGATMVGVALVGGVAAGMILRQRRAA